MHRSPSTRVVAGMTCQRSHIVTLIRQRLRKQRPDEPRRPRYSDPHRPPPQLGLGERRLNTMRHGTPTVPAIPTASARMRGSGRRVHRLVPCSTTASARQHPDHGPGFDGAAQSAPWSGSARPGQARRSEARVPLPTAPPNSSPPTGTASCEPASPRDIRRRQADGTIAVDGDAEGVASVLSAAADGLQIQWPLDPNQIDMGAGAYVPVATAMSPARTCWIHRHV